jgi:hypothetical protein
MLDENEEPGGYGPTGYPSEEARVFHGFSDPTIEVHPLTNGASNRPASRRRID